MRGCRGPKFVERRFPERIDQNEAPSLACRPAGCGVRLVRIGATRLFHQLGRRCDHLCRGVHHHHRAGRLPELPVEHRGNLAEHNSQHGGHLLGRGDLYQCQPRHQRRFQRGKYGLHLAVDVQFKSAGRGHLLRGQCEYAAPPAVQWHGERQLHDRECGLGLRISRLLGCVVPEHHGMPRADLRTELSGAHTLQRYTSASAVVR